MIKKISDLINIDPHYDRQISGLSLDSRHLAENNIFCACRGTQSHAKTYLEMALQKPIAAVFLEEEGEIFLKNNIPCIPYPNLTKELGILAAKFYDFPTQEMRVIGITGTNGKTSISHFIAQHLPQPCGLLGTLGNGIYGDLISGKFTTPFGIELQGIFHDLKSKNIKNTVMEVSSHALEQHRTAGINFEIGIFTNLTRDHLDYHGTMENYGAAKAKLFQDYPLKTAIFNLDDPFSQHLLQIVPQINVLTYSLNNSQASIFCNKINLLPNGYQLEVSTPLGIIKTKIKLIGDFNVSNILAAIGALIAFGIPLNKIKEKLFQTQAVAGRMELFQSPNYAPIIIDYAHTPDALEKALQSTRKHCNGKLWCIFGCGGDRDQGKRPLMGEIAEKYADQIILTNDNPRHEIPEQIISDIKIGLKNHSFLTILDRKQAISHALENAKKNDLILLAGKGHETYQQIGDDFLHYSDRETVQQLLG